MAEITKYEVDMLNVKAADAFLIHAFVKNTYGGEYEYVVLVDAGNEGDGDAILRHIRQYYGQHYVDLAICTHCDADHYGGFKRLIEEHNKKGDFYINKFWIHDPYIHVDVDDVKYIRKRKTLRERLNEAYSFRDGDNLIRLIDAAKIEREEPFTGLEYAPLNIKVLGPDEDYYESLIPGFRVDVQFYDEVDTDYQSSSFLQLLFSSATDYYSKTLEEAKDDGSPINQSSVVFLMEAKGEKLLFTGDAGREALHRVTDTDSYGECKNIDFFKVPHHGSKHNLDNALITHIHPSVSYISTERYGHYAHRCTVNALKQVGRVYSTHKEDSSLWHHRGTDPVRDGYSKAEAL